MKDYTNIDISALTLEDALNDANWNKKPGDVARFIALDKTIMRGFRRTSADESDEFVKALADYMLDGVVPDTNNMSPVVGLLLDSIIDSHEKRIDGEYLRQYKNFVNGKVNGKKKAE